MVRQEKMWYMILMLFESCSFFIRSSQISDAICCKR